MADTDIQRYLDGIEAQHSSKPKYMAHVEALLTKIDDAAIVIKDMPAAFDINKAVGAQLDILGDIVGADRRFPPVGIPGVPSLLDDDTFRYIALARVIRNQWDGSTENFHTMWDETIGALLDASYQDNQDMSMDIRVNGYIEPTMTEMVLRGYIIPTPTGVHANIDLSDETILDNGKLASGCLQTASSAHVGITAI